VGFDDSDDRRRDLALFRRNRLATDVLTAPVDRQQRGPHSTCSFAGLVG
jgi:hypothetical protein